MSDKATEVTVVMLNLTVYRKLVAMCGGERQKRFPVEEETHMFSQIIRHKKIHVRHCCGTSGFLSAVAQDEICLDFQVAFVSVLALAECD